MALNLPTVWPPASNADLGRFRFVIDVCEPQTTEVLLEFFEKYITVHSFHCLDELSFERFVESSPNHTTFVITDDACRPMDAVASATAFEASSSSHSQSSLLAKTTAAQNQLKSVRRRKHLSIAHRGSLFTSLRSCCRATTRNTLHKYLARIRIILLLY